MKYPKITIITPSFNQGQFIEQTLDSVLSQNYPDLEYFVFDGGSQDNSVEIIKKYEKHLTFWVSEKDNGQSHAINKGLQEATGTVVNWLNSDDFYEKDTLFKIATYFENSDNQVVCGKSRIFNEKEVIKISSGTDIYPNNLAKTLGWARIDQPETFFRLSAVQQMGFLNQNLHYVMDKEWWMRYLLHFGLKGIVKTDDILVNFRLHEHSKTVSQKQGFEDETHAVFLGLAEIFGLEKEKQILTSIGKNESILQKSDYKTFDKSLIQQAIHYYLLYQADFFYSQNQRQKAEICLQNIDYQLLDESDEILFSKLKSRLKIPVWLTDFVRKSVSLFK